MRKFGVITFLFLFLGVVLFALLSLFYYIKTSSSNGTPAIGFGLPLMVIPFVILACIPFAFVVLFMVLHHRKR